MKKLFTLLMLFVAIVTGASADDTYYYGCMNLTNGALTPGTTNTTQFVKGGATLTSSTDLSLSATPGTGSIYYNTSDLSASSLGTSSNWGTGSSSARCIRGLKFASGTSYTLALGTKVATSITFYGWCGSNDKKLTIGGVEKSTGSKNVFNTYVFTKDGNFTGNVTITQDGDMYGILVIVVSSAPATAHTVTFYAGTNGTCATTSITEASPGAGVTLPEVTPNSGYIFNGWYTADTGGEKVGDAGNNYKPSADTPLYAQYSEIPTPTFVLSASSIEIGQSAQIKVTGKDDLDGVTLSDIIYGTADIVTVNATTGVVTPVAAGSTTITFNSSAVAGKYNASSGNLSITVTVPKCATPTIATGDFNFENKGYKVTITSTEEGSTLKVSTDGSSYATQTSPYETYATATTHYYAKSIKDSYNDSDVADENVTNTFDGAKNYVAWVYTSDYSTGSSKPNYAFATDPMVIALQTVYNVVPVDYAQTVTPSADLKNADLIVCTEAMSGDKTMSNGMVALLDGTAPMIGLKMYNYGAGNDAAKRWKWGLPANPSSTVYGFTAKNANYKVLDGITFESDGTIKLASGRFNDDSYKNVVQTANFTGANKPTDNVILGTLDGVDTKAVMHYSATKKYFGLGLSSDCWSYYTPNATAIIKNAAAMLIAGEDLTATSSEDLHQKVAITTTSGNTYATYVTNNNLDFTGVEGITAYIATGDNGSTITTQAVTEVPTGTALLIKTASAGSTVNVPVAASTPATLTANKLKSSASPLEISSEQATAKRYYGFFKVGEKYGFAPMKAGTLAAKKAYLDYGVSGNSLQFIALDFDDAPTAINFIEAENNANSTVPVKVIKNGKLYIGNYNVAGQLVK